MEKYRPHASWKKWRAVESLYTGKNTFYDRKKAHFEKIQAEQEANYALKLVLVERAEAMKTSTDWQATTRAFADLMEEWKSIGKVPPEKRKNSGTD